MLKLFLLLKFNTQWATHINVCLLAIYRQTLKSKSYKMNSLRMVGLEGGLVFFWIINQLHTFDSYRFGEES